MVVGVEDANLDVTAVDTFVTKKMENVSAHQDLWAPNVQQVWLSVSVAAFKFSHQRMHWRKLWTQLLVTLSM